MSAITSEGKVYFDSSSEFEQIPIDWKNFQEKCTYKDWRFLESYVLPVVTGDCKDKVIEQIEKHDILEIARKELQKYLNAERFQYISSKIPSYLVEHSKQEVGMCLLSNVHKHLDHAEYCENLDDLETYLFSKFKNLDAQENMMMGEVE